MPPLTAADPAAHVGRVKFYDATKGFGFVEDFDAGADAYLGPDGLLSPPLEGGDVVRFVVERPDRPGKAAVARGVARVPPADLARLAVQYPQLAPTRRPGRVKFYDHPKAFGFITDLASGADVYVGGPGLSGPITDGDLVAFDLDGPAEGRSGRASHVRRISDEPGAATLALFSIPTDPEAWAVHSTLVATLAPLLDVEGWTVLTDRVVEEWADHASTLVPVASMSFEKRLTAAAGPEAGADFVRRIIDAASTPVLARLWGQGWDDAFSVEAAVAAYGEGKAERALSGTPTHLLDEVVSAVVGKRADVGALTALLEAAMRTDVAERRSLPSLPTPASRRVRRRAFGAAAADRFAIIAEAARAVASPDEWWDLFLEGHHDLVGLDDVLGHETVLSRPRVEGLLALSDIDEAHVEAVLVYAATRPPAGEKDAEWVPWLVNLANKHLPDPDAARVTQGVLGTLRTSSIVALWEGRALDQVPLDALVDQAGWKLSADGFARAVQALSGEDARRLIDARLRSQVHLWGVAKRDFEEAVERYLSPDDDLPYSASDINDGDAGIDALNATERLEREIPLTLDVANDTLLPADLDALVASLLPLPESLHVLLWAHGAAVEPPHEPLRRRFLDSPASALDEARAWIDAGRMDPAPLAGAVSASAVALPPVESRDDLAVLQRHVLLLGELGHAPPELAGRNADLLRVADWLRSPDLGPGFDLVADRHLPVYFEPADQVRLLRKLAALHERGDLVLTAAHLKGLVRYDADLDELAQAHHGVRLDLSAEVFIQVVVGLMGATTRLPEGGLLRIAYRGLSANPDRPLSLAHLDVFERCPGRMEDQFNPRNTSGRIERTKDHFLIDFPFDAGLIGAVKALPGRAFDGKSKRWTVPLEREDDVRAFAATHRFELHLTGHFMTDNRHLFAFRRGDSPRGVTYCEGREALVPDPFHVRPFWWCANQKCFQNAATPHEPAAWEGYTLLDVARALGCNLDEPTKSGGVIPNGRYYAFVGAVNRVNRLLEHLNCRSCSDPLYPEKGANFALYSVTQFWCLNARCSQHRKTVYLHHCLRGPCGSIIDSRDTRKCPNGWYVCTNDECGACCSDAAMSRRAQNLYTVGASGPPRGGIHGHLEHAEAFCHTCGAGEFGTRMEAHNGPHPRGEGRFTCPACGTEYDRRWRR